jgi:hypothetical protein
MAQLWMTTFGGIYQCWAGIGFFFSFWRTAGPSLHQISFNKNLVLYIFILFFYAGPGYIYIF